MRMNLQLQDLEHIELFFAYMKLLSDNNHTLKNSTWISSRAILFPKFSRNFGVPIKIDKSLISKFDNSKTLFSSAFITLESAICC